MSAVGASANAIETECRKGPYTGPIGNPPPAAPRTLWGITFWNFNDFEPWQNAIEAHADLQGPQAIDDRENFNVWTQLGAYNDYVANNAVPGDYFAVGHYAFEGRVGLRFSLCFPVPCWFWAPGAVWSGCEAHPTDPNLPPQWDGGPVNY